MSTRRYLVQSGYGKGAYKTRWSFDTMAQAYAWYCGINTGNGYKKRLVDSKRGITFYRQISQVGA